MLVGPDDETHGLTTLPKAPPRASWRSTVQSAPAQKNKGASVDTSLRAGDRAILGRCMRERRPSQTALLVALMRALADEGFTSAAGFSDPFAARLLSPGWSAARALLARALRRTGPARRDRAIAQLDVMPLRVLAIDAELEKAVAAGCHQLVLLGAGLDTRAYRMRSLAGVTVYEVDHPATQGYKRREASALHALAKSLVFVATNFEVDSLRPSLAAAGHRPDELTVWVWEGVVMYLSDEALRATLKDVAACSAAGSTLIAHYHTPRSVTVERRREQWVRRRVLSLWHEPQIGERDPETMHEAVRRAGFEVTSDTGTSEWATAFGARSPQGETASVSRLLVARAMGSQATTS
jgi:methyltransferase (TIGR00027 family)